MIKSCQLLGILLLVLPALRAVPLRAQDDLRVGIMVEPPFVIRDGTGGYTGLSVDLWERIAADQNWTYEWVEFQDHLGLMRGLDFREIDITINPMHVNELRLKMFDVTQPYFVSRVGVATTRVEKSQLAIFLNNLFSLEFARVILLLALVIFVFGTVLWLAERRHNRRQFRPGLMGLLDGLWWSAVTMTTVGYGDKAPKSQLGRIIAIVWMFTAVVIISGFTASIASTLTVKSLGSEVENTEDLRLLDRIGSVYASSSEDFLRRHDIPIRQLYDSAEEGLRGLSRKETEVFLYDRTVLHYLINQLQLDHKVSLLPASFNQQYRSFFLPKGSPLLEKVDPPLVREINHASWQELLRTYNLQEE